MLGIFRDLKSLLRYSAINIDNSVFLLHYKWTTLILLAIAILISSKQYFGNPIECISDHKEVKFNAAIDAYCWINSTYTYSDANPNKEVKFASHPGVGPKTENSETNTHKYYQWVGILLLLQAWFFYLPRFLWDKWEGGRMKILSAHMEGPHVSESEVSINRRKAVVKYLFKSMVRTDCYAHTFLFCELLNLTNLLLQMFITNAFLGNAFFVYGKENFLEFWKDSLGSDIHPMDRVFPKMAKCVFNIFGPSGNIVPYDVLCVLPLNVLNEKAFLFLWAWYILLLVCTICGLFERLVQIALPTYRTWRLRNCLSERRELAAISKEMRWSDWFVIHQLGKNVDPFVFAVIIKELSFLIRTGNTHSRQNSVKRIAERVPSVMRTYSAEPTYGINDTSEIFNLP